MEGSMQCIILLASCAYLFGLSATQAAEIGTLSYGSLMEAPKELYNSVNSLSQQQATVFPQGQVNPETSAMLRDSISKVTQLINSYTQSGLSNMPNLPNLPGLTTVMTVPDKILRAELSMLQDEIRMAQSMMQNPLYATMNVPKDLTNMVKRMTKQLEQ